MAATFRARIRQSLADANLQAALDANAARRIQVRQEAFASLHDPQGLRRRAHAVRADVIDHLEDYLQQFITQAAKNGLMVHQAADATQAIQLVLHIASQRQATLIAKSKTMVSEEIGLNHALGEHGLQVVETDLGEYIVQLRGEPPSHIITPAVHLRRQDVGRLFEQKLGLPYTEEISVMTDAARRTLRQVFLTAGIGLSGVNFGVAETGTLCVVTNEGNGRMVTTVPPVHIALMGIERLVPTMEDLALMLSVLPRSATGQKLSVYTNLLNRPRQPGDPDGPHERHLILVDNGRRAAQASGLMEILYCIRCGACLNACPVFREIGGHAYVSQAGRSSAYPGPLGSVISPALFGQREYGHLARASSLCGACREACPVDIDLPRLLLRVRSGVESGPAQEKPQPNAPLLLALGLKLYAFAASARLRFAIAQKLAGILGSAAGLFSKGDPWLRLPGWSGWGFSKDFPRPPARSFRQKYGGQLRLIPGASENPDPATIQRIMPTPVSEAGQPGSTPSGSLKERFAAELSALGGKFSECAAHELAPTILKLLEADQMRELLVWEDEALPPGLLGQLEQAGLQLIHPTAEGTAAAGQVRAGLTGALAGIAETGSVVLTGGKGMPLAASLLPELHLAILREQDIASDLGQVLARREVREAPAAVIISGPSRTADIEMTLTIGVHGPGRLHVLLLCEN